MVDDVDRDVVKEMLKMNDYIDLIIPRGRSYRFCSKNATIPTLETGIGNYHFWIRHNKEDGLRIIENAKIQRPGVCNALKQY